MVFLKIYLILLISTILLLKLISIIKKKYAYGIKYATICLLVFYLPILTYIIFF